MIFHFHAKDIYNDIGFVDVLILADSIDVAEIMLAEHIKPRTLQFKLVKVGEPKGIIFSNLQKDWP